MKQKPFKNRMPQNVNLSTRIEEVDFKDARAQRRKDKLARKHRHEEDDDWKDD